MVAAYLFSALCDIRRHSGGRFGGLSLVLSLCWQVSSVWIWGVWSSLSSLHWMPWWPCFCFAFWFMKEKLITRVCHRTSKVLTPFPIVEITCNIKTSQEKNNTFILAHNPRFQSSVRGRQISSDLKQLNTSCIVKSRARWMHRCLLVLGYLSPLLDNPEQKHGEWYTCRDCAFPHY